MFLTSLFSYSSTRSILSRASMRGAAARQRRPRALPASKPLHGDCNKWSAPSRVYPLTEQGFVPPGEGFASDSNNPVRKIIWSVPSRPEENPRGPNQVVPRAGKSGGLRPRTGAESQGAKSLVIQSSLNYTVIFNLFSQPSHRPPSGSAIRLCSARLGSGKSFLTNRRERTHLCNLSNNLPH